MMVTITIAISSNTTTSDNTIPAIVPLPTDDLLDVSGGPWVLSVSLCDGDGESSRVGVEAPGFVVVEEVVQKEEDGIGCGGRVAMPLLSTYWL